MEEIKKYRVDILGIAEVKRKGSGEVELDDGYFLLYAGVPRGVRAKEGVGVVMSSAAYSRVEEWEPVSSRIIFVDLQVTIGKLTIIQVYAPTEDAGIMDKEAFYSDLQRVIDRSRDKGRLVVLCGDFNARTGRDYRTSFGVMGPHGGEIVKNENGQRLIDFCVDNNLLVGNSFYPHKGAHKITFSSAVGNSVIDYFIYDREIRQYFRDVKVIRGAEIGTDHLLLVADTKILRTRKPIAKAYEAIKVRALDDPEKRKLYSAKLEESLRVLDLDGDAEKQWSALKTTIRRTAQEICGLQKFTYKGKRSKWWNDNVKLVINQKKQAWKSYQRHRTPENFAEYKRARNEAKAVVKVQKRITWEEFGKSLDDNHRENIKKFWRTVKFLKGKRAKPVRNVKDNNGVLLTETHSILDRWRRHYLDLFANEEAAREQREQTIYEVSEETINEEEVELAIEQMKTGKAAGRDNIAPEFLKYGGQELIKALQGLFQTVWDTKRIPKDWEYSVIIPIHKKGSQTECANYRPISLLSVAYKMYTHILEKRLRRIVERHLEEEQAGFRPGRQTQDNIFVIRNILEKSWDRNKNTYLAFLDLKAAFDSVPRQEIWNALAEKNVPRDLLTAIKSVYANSKGVVRINGTETAPFPIARGVKQGDSLSPLLFTVFMDEIHKICKRRTARTVVGKWNMRTILSQSLLYADDIVLICDTKEKLKQALLEWQEELKRKGMTINASKSKILVLSRDEEETVEVVCNGEVLEVVENFIYLGSNINKQGKIDGEIANRIAKANQIYYSICNSIVGHRDVGQETKLHIYKSVYLPTLTYGSESWIMLDKQVSRITGAEMRYLRRVVGKTRRDHVRNERIRAELKTPALKNILEKRQLKWFGHVCRMSEDREPRKVMEARPTGRRPRGRPRILYEDYIQRIGGKTFRELKQLCKDREAWQRWTEAPPR